MGLEPQGHLALADLGDEAVLGGVFAEQLQRPARATLRGIGAGQCHHLLLLASGELRRRSRTRSIVQGSFQALHAKALSHLPDVSLAAAHVLRDLGVNQTFI
jgi:hypothetical protein